MNDWRTSLTGIVGGAAFIASHYNLVIPPDFQAGIIALAVAVIGWLSKDKHNTGE